MALLIGNTCKISEWIQWSLFSLGWRLESRSCPPKICTYKSPFLHIRDPYIFLNPVRMFLDISSVNSAYFDVMSYLGISHQLYLPDWNLIFNILLNVSCDGLTFRWKCLGFPPYLVLPYPVYKVLWWKEKNVMLAQDAQVNRGWGEGHQWLAER